MSKDKVHWTKELESHFILLCHQAQINHQLLTSSFSPTVLQEMALNLNAIAKRPNYFTQSSLRNKWKNLKAIWKVLYAYKTNLGSGLGWDEELGSVTGAPDVLEGLYAKARDHKSIIKGGLQHFEMCTELFKNSVATGRGARLAFVAVTDDEREEQDVNPSPVNDQNIPPSSSHPVEKIVGGSRRSSRKRSSLDTNDDNERFKKWMNDFHLYMAKKMSMLDQSEASIDVCMEIVQNMEGVPLNQMIKASDRFMDPKCRKVFSRMSADLMRAWVLNL